MSMKISQKRARCVPACLLLAVAGCSAGAADEAQEYGTSAISSDPRHTPMLGPSVSFGDDFDAPSLGTEWGWINESQSDWSLTADPGKLRMRRYQGHGFYQTPETEHNQTPVPVLNRGPVSLGDGFVAKVKVGFYASIPFGQAGLLIYKDFDNYIKVPIEFFIQTDMNLVMVQEVGGVHQNGNNGSIDGSGSIPWRYAGENMLSAEVRLTYSGGNLLAEGRGLPDGDWVTIANRPCLLAAGDVLVGLYTESDQPSAGSDQYAWFDDLSVVGAF